jgi:anti-sigma factor RsiW
MSTHPQSALLPYLRDELDADERTRVADHLQGCAECRQSADSLAALSAELARRMERMPVPEWTAYRAQLHRKLAAREQTAERRWWHPGLAWGSLATAGVAVAALMLVLTIRSGPGTPSVEQLAMENEMASADIGLLRNYPVVEHLELLEDYDVIEHLDELPPATKQGDAILS